MLQIARVINNVRYTLCNAIVIKIDNSKIITHNFVFIIVELKMSYHDLYFDVYEI